MRKMNNYTRIKNIKSNHSDGMIPRNWQSIIYKKDGTRKGCRYYCANGIVLDADWNASINIACRKHSISFNTPVDGQLNFLDRVQSITQSSDVF